MPKATWIRPCTHCGVEVTLARRPSPGLRLDCGKTECRTAVTEAHNAECAAVRAARAALPKQPRQRRAPQPLYGDVAWMAAFNGIKTDGSGKRAR